MLLYFFLIATTFLIPDPPTIDKIIFKHFELNHNITVNETIHVIENETFTLICEARSKPESSYKWTGKTSSNFSTVIIVNPSTRKNYMETCHATNIMKFSNAEQETVNVNRSVSVNILCNICFTFFINNNRTFNKVYKLVHNPKYRWAFMI